MASKNKLFQNIFSLSGLQLANYVLPMITVPYVVRIIGPEKYGLVNFAQAYTYNFVLIILYGFELSATRKIAILRNKKERLNYVFCNTFYAQFFLFIISTLLFFLPILFFEKFDKDQILYLYSYPLLIGTLLFPTWLYAGLQQIAKRAAFNFIIRLIFTLAIFIFVRGKEDYIFLPISLSLGQVAVSIVTFIFAIKSFNIRFIRVKAVSVLKELKDGLMTFFSVLISNFYNNMSIFILGIMTNDINVGYFTAVSKIVLIVKYLVLLPISQSLYPYIGSKIAESQSEALRILKKAVIITGTLSLIVCCFVIVFASPIVKIIFGDEFMASVSSLRIVAFIPFLVSLSYMFGIQGLLNLKLDKEYLKVIAFGGVINIALNFLLIPYFEYDGTSIAWIVTELFIAAGTYFYLVKNKIKIFSK